MDSHELMMKAADALAEDDLKEAERLFLMASETDSTSYLPFYNLGVRQTVQVISLFTIWVFWPRTRKGWKRLSPIWGKPSPSKRMMPIS